MKIRSTLVILLLAGAGLYAGLGVVAGAAFSLNATLAYVTILFVMGSSFYSSYVKLSSQTAHAHIDEREELDKIGDRYGVFEEDLEDEIDEAEREETKKNSPKMFTWSNIMLGSKLFFSLYRLMAYGIMVIVVLYLVRHEMFEPYGFIAGVLAAFIVVVALLGISLRRANRD